MSDDLWELKQRLSKLPNEELIEMVTVAAKDYRQEAIDYATQELRYRHVDLSKLNSQGEEAIEESEREPEAEAASVQPFVPIVGGKCICGGTLRSGTLVAEKELTIIFSDNHEERFVRALACTRCSQISLIVDSETVVSN
jgi:hypothetical protein